MSPIQRLRETFRTGDPYAHLKLALGINRDDGLQVVISRLQEGLKQARLRKAAATKLAGLAALGAARGVLAPDKGETRGQAARHGAGVGLAGDLGGLAGAGAGYAALGGLSALPRSKGTLGRVLYSLRRAGRKMGPVGAIGGAAAGSLLAMNLARDEPKARQVRQVPTGTAASY